MTTFAAPAIIRPNPTVWLKEREIDGFGIVMRDTQCDPGEDHWGYVAIKRRPDGKFYLPTRDKKFPAHTPVFLAEQIIQEWEYEGSNKGMPLRRWLGFTDEDLMLDLATTHLRMSTASAGTQRLYDRENLYRWNPVNNYVQVIGGGSYGQHGTGTSGGGGGGGGGFARTYNVDLMPGANNLVLLGIRGDYGVGEAGPSFICNGPTTAYMVCNANGGTHGAAAGGNGLGGAGTIGNVLYNGGAGGDGAAGTTAQHQGGGGGGGAAGPYGNGGVGAGGGLGGGTVAVGGGRGGNGGAGYGGAGGAGVVGGTGNIGQDGADCGLPENSGALGTVGSGGGGAGGGYGAAGGAAKYGGVGGSNGGGGGGTSGDLTTGGAIGQFGQMLFWWTEGVFSYMAVM